MSTMTVLRRFTATNPCPVCGGHPSLPRGRGIRCAGFETSDEYLHCTRPEHAGSLEATGAAVPTFAHIDRDDCRCGQPHARHGGAAASMPRTSPRPERRVTHKQSWEIRAADGSLAALHWREDYDDGTKAYRWQAPDGAWTLPAGATAAMLYGAEAVAGPYPKPLVLVEGEKSADALRSLGFAGAVVVATVCGAQTAVSRAALELARDRRVYVWPDFEAAGRKHMRQASQTLVDGITSDVRVIEWGEHEKDDAADFVARGGTRAKLAELVKAAQLFAPTSATEPSEQSRAAEVVWKEAPIPLEDAFARPPFPVEALPSWAAQWVREVAQSTQTPLDMSAMLFLAVLSAAASKSVVVDLTPDWRETVNLFVVVIAESGERKSRVFELASAPLREWERRRIDLEKSAHVEALTRRKVSEKRAEELRTQAAKDKGDKRNQLIEEAIAEETLATGIHVPPLPRLLADDVTPEALVGLMADCGGRTALLSAEGGFFATLAGRYSKGVPNLDAVLKAHGGETIRVDRKSRPPEWVERPALTLGFAVQPQVLRDAFAIPELRGRGLLARFLFGTPRPMVGRRSTTAPSANASVINDYRVRIERFAESWAVDHGEARVLYLHAESRAAFDAFRDWVEPQLAEHGDLRHVADWGSKLPGAVARIAGLLHLAEESRADQIPIETVRGAIDIGRYLVEHARAAFGLVGADPALTAALRVQRELAKAELSEFSARDLMARLPRPQFPKASTLQTSLDLLEEYGWVQKLDEPARQGAGRKASPRYAVHPELLRGVSAVSTQQAPTGLSADSADSLLANAATNGSVRY